MRNSLTPVVILGPCRCQGCDQQVLYIKQRVGWGSSWVRGWLHDNGSLVCSRRPYRRTGLPSGMDRREYFRARRSLRAAA